MKKEQPKPKQKKTVVTLLRGINVGGRHKIPMPELVKLLTALEVDHIQTYIQSGNLIFNTAKSLPLLSEEITTSIQKQYGFSPTVCVYDADKFKDILSHSPFSNDQYNQKHSHIFFFHSKCNPTEPLQTNLKSLKSDSEKLELTPHAAYLYAPDGIGRSKLVSNLEAQLNIPITGRNLRTVRAIMSLIEGNNTQHLT